MKILGTGKALPKHYYSQDQLLEALREELSDKYFNFPRVEKLHKNVLVGGRHLAIPLEDLRKIETFGQANNHFIEQAQKLGETAIVSASEQAGTNPADLNAILFTTVTGLATPSIDARLMNRLSLRPDTVRMPFFGLGCVGGAAGLSRCNDWLLGHPDKLAVLLTVELCSLTLQRTDLSIPNLISTGLFGDGAAAVVCAGSEHPLAQASPGPEVVATKSIFFPDTESAMGWNISEKGFGIVLSAEVPGLVRTQLRGVTESFLSEHGLGLDDLSVWICHPGGPKVLTAVQDALGITREDLAISWDNLEAMGNLSSASVLINLGETIERISEPGQLGLLLAMGPGFCAELVLLKF